MRQGEAAVAARANPAIGHDRRHRCDRSISIRDSVADVEETLLIAVVLVIAGHLPVPAFGVRDVHPGAGGSDLADRHLRGDVRARTTRSTT